MSLKSTRKILTFLCVFLIGASSFVLLATQIAKLTVCSQGFVQRFVFTEGINNQARENFKVALEALENESSIPARAFEAIYNDKSAGLNEAVERLYNGHDATLYNDDTVDRFERLCIEYLEGNQIKYDKKLVHNTAQRATRLYSDCFGIQNAQMLKDFIDGVRTSSSRYASASLLVMLVGVCVLFVLYKKQGMALEKILQGFTAQGLAFIVCPLICLLARIGQHSQVYPLLYAQACSNLVRSVYFIALVIGILICTVSLLINVNIIKKNIKNS